MIGAPARPHVVKSRILSLQILVNILLIVNVFVCIALVAIVLIQRSEGGALGMGGGGAAGGFMTARGAGDLLTRTTWILAFSFFTISLVLTVLTGKLHGGSGSIVDHINPQTLGLATPQGAPTPAPAAPASTAPAIQAPTPKAQTLGTPAAPAPQDPYAILGTPTVHATVTGPAPTGPAAAGPAAPPPANPKK